MPITLASKDIGNQQSCTTSPCKNPSAECIERSSKILTIGLINNMPDSALEATERQFTSLLDSACGSMSISLRLYALPGVPRGELGAARIAKSYADVEEMWDAQLDGLIVTGREPLTPNLADEPYWESFTKVLEWARDHTASTIWSCLAAHAAVLHMDGIGRIRSNHKRCGVYDCARVMDHPLTTGAPSRFKLPHSRWNGIAEQELKDCGYRILTQSAEAGVDSFVKEDKSMFVFFQGHPEYEVNTLLLEYRRDIGRYFRGEAAVYPIIPHGYFDAGTELALAELGREARLFPREELMREVSTALENACIDNSWHTTAACIYKNWLNYLSEQKKQRLQASRVAKNPNRSESSIHTMAGAGSISPIATPTTGAQAPSTLSTVSLSTLTIL
jgi:homoserine O-succinyltransferase